MGDPKRTAPGVPLQNMLYGNDPHGVSLFLWIDRTPTQPVVKPLSYTPHMRPRMGRCGTKTAQNRILKTKTKRKYALTDPFCCQRRQATSWLRQQNAPPQILVHCQCLEKNQDITHAGGPTLSNKISESFGMWCQNDQKK